MPPFTRRTINESIGLLLDANFITREEAIFNSRERKTFEEKPKVTKKAIWS